MAQFSTNRTAGLLTNSWRMLCIVLTTCVAPVDKSYLKKRSKNLDTGYEEYDRKKDHANIFTQLRKVKKK